MGELWDVFCEYLWENWPRYNGTALYVLAFFFIILRQGDATSSWYPSARKIKTRLLYMVNTMAADNLASHWAIVLVPHPHPMGDSLQPIFSVQVCDIRYITHILQMKYSKLCKL